MIAFAYTRVSTVGQAVDGVSLAAQRSKIKAWCELNDHSLNADSIFADKGKSGAKMNGRPELQKLLKAIRKHKSKRSVLVIYSLSRLARSTKDAISLAEMLDKSNCDLVSLSENLDGSSASGRMLYKLLAVLGEFEAELIGERTKLALQHKRSRGERISGKIPFGYDLCDDGITLVENKSEQATIREILKMRHKQNETLQGCADRLTWMKIPTKTGSKKWSHATIQSILKRVKSNEVKA